MVSTNALIRDTLMLFLQGIRASYDFTKLQFTILSYLFVFPAVSHPGFAMWVFTIVGDANVRDNMTTLNMSSREVMRKAQVLTCPPLSDLSSVLKEIRLAEII